MNNDNIQPTPEDAPGGEQLIPAEKAYRATAGQGVGQARFKNAGLTFNAKPTNELPEGEDPAAWFIVGGKYVDCNGLTPDQVRESQPEYWRKQAEELRAASNNVVSKDAHERAIQQLEIARLELLAKDAEIDRLTKLQAAKPPTAEELAAQIAAATGEEKAKK